jgi:ABC-2 type transport system ATP-binding protein/lipopolysaccharide transport system ATP-binding protein
MAFLHLRNLSVEFPIYQGSSRSLKKMLLAPTTYGNLGRDAADRINVRALDDLTLDIEDGERVGLIGANGAGKTTLLRVLAGIYSPTRGQFHSAGRISALLDVSVGFNPEATGRENIILRGMYMNIHPREMRAHVEEIVEFAELGPYIDMPARTYSSGMMVRLGFAISTCMPAEILLMDEWLSAGDVRFLDKAQKRMEEFVGRSRILVLASHSTDLIRKWCNRGIMLQHGRIAALGDINEVIGAYIGAPAPALAGGQPLEILPDEMASWQQNLDDGLGERSVFLRQRDVALGERNELLRQRDLAIGLTNLQADRLARYVHRSDVATRRATAAARSGRSARASTHAVATRDRILFFLYLRNTGAPTLTDILLRNLDTKDFLVIDNDEVQESSLGTWSDSAAEKAFARLKRSQIDDVRFVWGPYRHGFQNHLPKASAGVTFLREPLERVILHYSDWASATKNAGRLDEAFAVGQYPLITDNYMTRILSGVATLDPPESAATTQSHPRVTTADFEKALSNLDSYRLVGLTDRFDEMLLLLAADLSWSFSDLVYKPRDATEFCLEVAETATSVRDKVLELNRYDLALVERARAHLARRIAAYGGDFEQDLALFRRLNELFQQGAPVEDLRRMEYDAIT